MQTGTGREPAWAGAAVAPAAWGVRAVLKPGEILIAAGKRKQMKSQRQFMAVLSLQPGSGLGILTATSTNARASAAR
jgi:hypothetical protein